ncbi:ROK family transcriptional regulator [Micrococcales bacterium 31B]|nr:ROK family transcriptional regulator [Micrococcales bacterium 31B]
MALRGDANDHWSPLQGSEQAVALEVLRRGPIARVDLARRLGLSSGSLTRLTKPLIENGLLVEGAAQPIPLGRPTLPLDVKVRSALFIGVKLVADAAYLVVTDLRANILDQGFLGLSRRDPEAVAAALAEQIECLRSRHEGIAAVGVSLGARVRNHEFVIEGRYLGWGEVPFAAMLNKRCHLPVALDNDVQALTQSELWFGVGRGLERFAVVTLGAGIGCGVVVGGELLPLPAGDITHVIVDPDARETCSRGHRGCAEALLLAERVLQRAREAVGDPALSFDEMLARALEIPAVVERAAYDTGVLIAHVANLLAPEKVVLLGEGVGFAALFEQAMRRGANALRGEFLPETHIEIPPFEFYEWARGAAVVAVQGHVLGAWSNSGGPAR